MLIDRQFPRRFLTLKLTKPLKCNHLFFCKRCVSNANFASRFSPVLYHRSRIYAYSAVSSIPKALLHSEIIYRRRPGSLAWWLSSAGCRCRCLFPLSRAANRNIYINQRLLQKRNRPEMDSCSYIVLAIIYAFVCGGDDKRWRWWAELSCDRIRLPAVLEYLWTTAGRAF